MALVIPPMKYLSRSLPAGNKRFAIVPSDTKTQWEFLGVTPITYQLRGSDKPHADLTELIRDWGKESRVGVLEHDERIGRLLQRDAELTAAEDDYLRRALRDPVKCQFFRSHAGTPRWLKYAADHGALTQLFDPLHRAIRSKTASLRTGLPSPSCGSIQPS